MKSNGADRLQAVSLATLEVGEAGQIAQLTHSASFETRLRELGFVPGTIVRVRRSAPLRDPIEYEVRQGRICLRRSEAERILVQRVPREA